MSSSSSSPAAAMVARFIEQERKRYEDMPPEKRLPCFLSPKDKKKILIYRNVEILLNKNDYLRAKDRRQRHLILKIAEDFFSIFAEADELEEIVLVKRPRELRKKLQLIFGYHREVLGRLKKKHLLLNEELRRTDAEIERLGNEIEKRRADFSLCSSKLTSSFYENSVRVILQAIAIEHDRAELEKKILQKKMKREIAKFEIEHQRLIDEAEFWKTKNEELKNEYARYKEFVALKTKREKMAFYEDQTRKNEKQLHKNERYNQLKLQMDRLNKQIQAQQLRIEVCRMEKERRAIEDSQRLLADSEDSEKILRMFRSMTGTPSAAKTKKEHEAAKKEETMQGIVAVLEEVMQ